MNIVAWMIAGGQPNFERDARHRAALREARAGTARESVRSRVATRLADLRRELGIASDAATAVEACADGCAA